jgi:hypothetical protein
MWSNFKESFFVLLVVKLYFIFEPQKIPSFSIYHESYFTIDHFQYKNKL